MAQMSPLGDSPLFGLLPTRLQDELVEAGQPARLDRAVDAGRRAAEGPLSAGVKEALEAHSAEAQMSA